MATRILLSSWVLKKKHLDGARTTMSPRRIAISSTPTLANKCSFLVHYMQLMSKANVSGLYQNPFIRTCR